MISRTRSAKIQTIALILCLEALAKSKQKSNDSNDEGRSSFKPPSHYSTTSEHLQAILDDYYVALTQPSSEHAGTYVKLCILLGIIGYAAWYLLVVNRREVVNFKVNLSDIGGESKASDHGSTQEKGQLAAGSSTAKKGDTKDTTGTEV
jgi:hypothetical protein